MGYFERTKIVDIIHGKETDKEVIILGWVRTKRGSKNVAFLEINDGSTLTNVQVIFAPPSDFPQLESILTGASVRLKGKVVEVQGREQAYEIQGDELELIGEAGTDYPLQKKRHSFEFLREIAHLRARTNTQGVVNRFRSKMSYCIHRYFHERDFYYIHTPIITTSDCEGAGNLFQITTLNLENFDNQQKRLDYEEDFFGEKASLTVSGQLEAELMAMALGDVYTFGPTFRAENSNTSRHLSEFWMIEPEMAFCDQREMLVFIEDFLKYMISYYLVECEEESDFFHLKIDSKRRPLLNKILDSSFAILSYTEAVEILKKAPCSFEYPVEWGLDLQSEHERYLTEEYCKSPVSVIDYPRSIKPFYMWVNDDEKTVRAVDVLVPQIGEIIGGSQREERYTVLKNNMLHHSIDIDRYKWYLDIRKYGTAPHSGFGLGFERMLMYLSGMENIRDVIPFPRTPGYAKF